MNLQVKEARSFVKPSDGLMKQLEKLNENLFGKNQKEEIEDPFTRKKRLEIEAEKAALSKGVKLKDRVKMFADPITSPPTPGIGGGIRNESPRPSISGANKWTTSPTPQPASNNNNNNNNNVPRRPSFEPETKVTTDRKFSSSNRTDSIASIDGQPKKLTSIISLFNKPRESISNESNNRMAKFSSDPMAPVKKWKTVEPPPPPGFCRNNLKKNKSRKFTESSVRRNKSKGNLETQDSIKRNKSKDNLKKQPSIQNSIIPEASSIQAAVKENGSSNGTTTNPTTFRRQKSTTRQESVTKVAPIAPTPPPPPPPPPPPKSLFQEPTKSSSTPSSSSSASSSEYNPTPWRGKKTSREEAASVIKAAINEDPNYNMKPGETRYRTSVAMTPAKDGSITNGNNKSVQRQNSSSLAKSSVPAPPPPPPPPPPVAVPPALVPPPPPAAAAGAEKKVFGKGIRPPQMKIIGGSISVTEKDAPPPAVKSILKPQAVVQPEVTKVATPPKAEINNNNNESSKQNKNYSRVKSVESENGDEDEAEDEESEDEEEEEEEDDDEEDEYTQVYDFTNGSNNDTTDGRKKNQPADNKYSINHCKPSGEKGLNRSSTMEILKLIKSKTGSDLSKNKKKKDQPEDNYENEEIDALLAGLEDEGIDNVDWDELGIDVEEVKEIVEKHEDDDDEEEEEDEEEEDEEEEDEVETEEEEEVTLDTRVTLKRPTLRI